MKKRIIGATALLIMGSLAGLLVGATVTTAQFTSPPDSHGVMYLANHHQELSLILTPGQPQTFSLPKNNVPVSVQISTSNVPVTFNTSSLNLGPMMISGVATYDSTAGLGNITAESNPSTCPGMNSCSIFQVFHLPVPESNTQFLAGVMELAQNRQTGLLSVSVST